MSLVSRRGDVPHYTTITNYSLTPFYVRQFAIRDRAMYYSHWGTHSFGGAHLRGNDPHLPNLPLYKEAVLHHAQDVGISTTHRERRVFPSPGSPPIAGSSLRLLTYPNALWLQPQML